MDALSSTTSSTPVSSFSLLSYSQRRDATFAITTTEGDAVNISLSKSSALQYASYNSSGTTNGESTSVSALQYSATQSASISIDGDLNPQELHDVHKAIQAVEKTYRDLEKGHLFQAEKRIAQLSKYENFAKLDATVSSQQSLVAVVG